MIIVKLHGGLGNQLFQYSLGRNLAIKNKTQLKLDLRTFETYKLHKFSLKFFNISAEIAFSSEIRKYKRYNHTIKDKIFNYFNRNPEKITKELNFNFIPEILNSPDNTYLEGYWQSEKYFRDSATVIKDEITLKPEFSQQGEDVLGLIKTTNSISLHIRRADYITNEKTFMVHGACSTEYYQNAVEKLQTVDDKNLFIFSDDILWAKENIRLPFPSYFVDHGADKNYLDLYLMSQCRHNIIANSSFSWWGAWLNNNPDKIVIAPKNWFNDQTRDDRDLLPQTWIKL